MAKVTAPSTSHPKAAQVHGAPWMPFGFYKLNTIILQAPAWTQHVHKQQKHRDVHIYIYKITTMPKSYEMRPNGLFFVATHFWGPGPKRAESPEPSSALLGLERLRGTDQHLGRSP